MNSVSTPSTLMSQTVSYGSLYELYGTQCIGKYKIFGNSTIAKFLKNSSNEIIEFSCS